MIDGHAKISVNRNVFANYAGSAWSALMGFAFLPLYITYLGMEAYGLIAVFVALQSWFSLIDASLGPTLVREMARFRGGEHTSQSIGDLLRSLEMVFLVLSSVAAVGIAVVAPWLGHVWLNVQTLSAETVTHALMIMGVLIALRWIAGLYRSAITGLQEHIWLNVIVATFATLRGAGAVAVLAWLSPTIHAFFIFQGVTAALEAAVLAAVTYRLLPSLARRSRFSPEALLRVRNFAGGMAVITILALLLTQVDKLLLAGLLPLADFGHYALASVVASSLYMFALPIGTAIGPRLAELVAQDDEAALRTTYHTYAQLLTVCVAPAALVIVFFSEPLLRLWTQDAALAASVAPLASMLMIGTLLHALMHLPYKLTLAYGWTQFAIVLNAIFVAIFVPMVVLAVPVYGAYGAAAIWVALNIGNVLFGVPLIHRRYLRGELTRWYVVDVLLIAIPSLGAIGVVKLMLLLFETSSDLSNLVAILFAATVAQTAAAIASPVMRRKIFSCATLLRQRFTRNVRVG